jgi:hypothetical protein
MVLAMATETGLFCIENSFRWCLFVVVEVKSGARIADILRAADQSYVCFVALPELSCCVVKSASKATHHIVWCSSKYPEANQ